MDSKEHRDWLQKVMADHGLNEKRWAEKAGLSTPNVLYNYFKGTSKSISEKNCDKLAPVIGLTPEAIRRGPLAASLQALSEPKQSAPKSPKREALALHDQILAICEGVSEEAQVYVDVDQLAYDMKEILNQVQEQPKLTRKKRPA